SLKDWTRAAKKAGLTQPSREICCYPQEAGFVNAMAARIRATFAGARRDIGWRLLLSAHGLPKRTIEGGDPYQRQVEQTAAAILRELAMPEGEPPGFESVVCYQSRVGPLEWI